MAAPLLVRAARLEPVEHTPVWFMRQAGRSLPEYRKLREGRSLFDVVRDPELCAEVTLQPVRRHGVDAAVMFADIMLPVLGMGIDVDLVENVGPVISRPVTTTADVERLRVPDPPEAVSPILEAVRIVRAELREDQAVVGFCGGPFTVAGYVVEGKPTREFTKVKALMYREPAVWHALMEKMAATFAAYVAAQAAAGADVIQLFDSWVGALSGTDYDEFAAPYSARILGAVDVPTIHFGTGTAHLLERMASAGGDVVGLDWRVPLDEGWARVGDDRGVQGNLDPAVLLGPWERVEDATRDILDRAGGRPGHIFNLGHENWPASPDESHPFYWRREAELYASGLLAQLAPPFRAVDCRACIERADGTVALWLEDVTLPRASTWPLERYGVTAFQLGRAQGELVASPPSDAWLSRRWLRAYVNLRAPVVHEHGAGATYELWLRRDEVLARIEAAPQTLNHLDFYPSNLFGDDHETVAVDWAYCGLAAVGEDAANLAPDTLLDGFLPAETADELEALVWRSYLDGLRAGGFEPDERKLRFVFVASVGVKYAWIEAAIRAGRAREGWAPVVPFLDRLATEALELASSA